MKAIKSTSMDTSPEPGEVLIRIDKYLKVALILWAMRTWASSPRTHYSNLLE